MEKNLESNYMEVGRTIECGHCNPETFGAGLKQAQEMMGKDFKCECVCHDAPSQPSRTGFELNNRTSGTVANTHYPPEVRDEKIARIVKEFWEKFTYHPDGVWNPETARIELPEYIPLTIENVEAWLTQTLTTLLNEE